YETELNCSLNPISQYFNLSSNVFNVKIGQIEFQIGYSVSFDDSIRNTTFSLTCNANSIPLLNKQYDPAFALVDIKKMLGSFFFVESSFCFSQDLISSVKDEKLGSFSSIQI
ncbi:hypothetical protein BpHYR1_021883, partial [Brachionus plicatilis]